MEIKELGVCLRDKGRKGLGECRILMKIEGLGGFGGLLALLVDQTQKAQHVENIAFVVGGKPKFLQGAGIDFVWERSSEMSDHLHESARTLNVGVFVRHLASSAFRCGSRECMATRVAAFRPNVRDELRRARYLELSQDDMRDKNP